MSRKVRIGNAHGFWGDRLEAAAEMLALEPDLDYLTLDFLAEVSMSILALQQQRDPHAGYAKDFVDVVESLAPYWRDGGKCCVITNAGGLNPQGCAEACRAALLQAGCPDMTIAVVTGDNVLELIRADYTSSNDAELLRNLDTHESIDQVIDKLATANVYLGAAAVREALSLGAVLVITGRVADPSLTVGPCMFHFGWASDAWDRIAGATIAGHLIECGTQVTGGIFTDWMEVPNVGSIGFPIVEVADDGSCVVTKPRGSGGIVSAATVKEQLLYEIGDPDCYLSPDVTVSFTSLHVEEIALDRVSVVGAKGHPVSETLKISATWLAGYRAAGQLTIFGERAVAKANRAAKAILGRLEARGVAFRQTHIDLLGAGACRPFVEEQRNLLHEVGLRIAVADESRDVVEKFARSFMPLVTAGPPGTTGYSEGRPRVHAQFAFWPCLIRRDRIQTKVDLLPSPDQRTATRSVSEEPVVSRSFTQATSVADEAKLPRSPTRTTSLVDIAHARSGDKGRHANIGVIARQTDFYDRLLSEVTVDRVSRFLRVDRNRVERFELPTLCALNFVIRNILANPLRLDSQGKALGQFLLQMPLDVDP